MSMTSTTTTTTMSRLKEGGDALPAKSSLSLGEAHCRERSYDDVVDVDGCGERENGNVSPPSAFPIPASGGDIGGDVGSNVSGSGNNNNSGMNGTNTKMSVRRRRKMYSEST